MDPKSNIYPHILPYCNCSIVDGKLVRPENPFCKHLDKYDLQLAIHFLQIERVKELLKNITSEQLLEIQLYERSSYFETRFGKQNILESIIFAIGCEICNVKNIPMLRHKYDAFDGFNNIQRSVVMQIIECLLHKQPKLLTKKCFNFAKHKPHADVLIKILCENGNEEFKQIIIQ